MPSFPARVDLTGLDGSNGFKLSGSGAPVASAGDVNGDGFDDLIVGAAAVVFGKALGFAANLALSSLDGSNGFTISGIGQHDYSASSVGAAGDVNGDGFADLIIGAVLTSPHGDKSGTSYVVFGKASGFAADLDLSSLDGSNGFKLSGVATGDFSGGSVASAGDVNGDGFADLIIGAAYADPHGESSGASYVVFGKASGFSTNLDLSSLNGSNGFKLSGVAAGELSGCSVASAGDVNGDGFADLIIGAKAAAGPHGDFSGASYVVFGKASGFAANLNLSSLNGSNGFRLRGESAGDKSGYSVASAGDVNGDGFDDLIVGAPGDAGVAYVVFGKASGFAGSLNLSSLDGSNGFKLIGPGRFERGGASVASAGDVNGDGFDDLIVGAPYANANGDFSGASYVVFGKASGFDAELRLWTLDGTNGFELDGVAAQDNSGRSVASAGDLNGDGFDDVIIGTYRAGVSYVVFGHAPEVPLDLVGTDAPDTLTGSNVDDTLSGLGGDDTLSGRDGNDTLDGGDGVDTMVGGGGDDTYHVDNPLDVVTEAASGGTDTILSTSDYQLAAAIEVEILAANPGSAGLSLTGNEFDNTINGAGGDDTLTGDAGDDILNGNGGDDTLNDGPGDDILRGNDGDDTLVARDFPFYASNTYDGGAGSDTLLLADGVADFSLDTFSSVEHFVGSSGGDDLIFRPDQFMAAFSTFDGGAGNDKVTLQFDTSPFLHVPLDLSTMPGPTITSLESLWLRGTGDVDTITLSAPQFAAFDRIDLGDSAYHPDIVNVVVNGTTDLTTAIFPTIVRVEQVNLQGTGSVRLTVDELGKFTSIAAGLDVTLADRPAHLEALTPTAFAQLAGKGVDRIDSTTDFWRLSAAQYQALGSVALTAADTVRLAGSSAALAALTPLQIGELAAKGIDWLDATNNTLTLTAAQATALNGVMAANLDLVTVADMGNRLDALTPAEIASLNAAQIDRLDATDDALSLTLDQFNALDLITLAVDDALALSGTAGDDELDFSRQPFNVADQIDGGSGNDVLWLVGDYSSLAFQAATMTDVEMLLVGADHDYGLTLADGNAGAGQQLTVNAGNLGAADSFSVDGSAETDGSFRIVGGDGANTMTGGNGGDTMWLGGADLVRYTAAAQSTSTGYDILVGFDAAVDHLHVASGVTAVDAPITAGALSKVDFDGDLATAMTGLAAHHAALFTANAGGFAGRQFLVVDTNDTTGYQAGADLVVRLDGAAHLDQFGMATFL